MVKLLLQVFQFTPQKRFIGQFVKVEILCQEPDVSKFFPQKIIDILFMLLNQRSQMGMDLFLIGSIELVKDYAADKNHGGEGNNDNSEDPLFYE